MTDKNQYSLELLEKRLNESDSLVEHVLIACDLIEFQVNRMLNVTLNMKIVKELNFSSEQRFSYALASSFALGTPDKKYPEDLYYFWGRLNEVYNLRRMMRNLTPAELEERVKRLYHVGKFDKNEKNWQAIITLINSINESAGDYAVEAVDLWDPFVLTLYSYLLSFVDSYLANVNKDDETTDVPAPVTADNFDINPN
jgi:hypothetical protein